MVLRAKQVSGDDQQQKSEPCLKCPRCGSTNTKFCYYNNYNKSQPRHFCKSCKRHWTKDGTLRNVPVGGGGRKNKRRPSISKSPVKIINSVPSKNVIAVSDQQHCSDFSSFIAGLCADRDKGTSHNHNFFNHGMANQSSSSSLLHNMADGIQNIRDPCNDASRTGMNVPVETKYDPVLSSDLSAFDHDKDSLIINPASYQSMNAHTDPCIANAHTIEESIITSVDIPSTSTISPWPETTISSALDLPNYWNWSEIDALSNQDDLDISWADVDTVIKP